LLSRSTESRGILGRSLDGAALSQSHQAMINDLVYGNVSSGSYNGSYEIGLIPEDEAKENLPPGSISAAKSASGKNSLFGYDKCGFIQLRLKTIYLISTFSYSLFAVRYNCLQRWGHVLAPGGATKNFVRGQTWARFFRWVGGGG
jgi:hypothetical protein